MNLFWTRFPQCHVVPVFTGFITASKIIGRHIKRQKRGSKIVYQETESSQEEQRMYKKNRNKALYNTNTVAATEREWSYVNESLHSRFYRIGVKLFMCSIKVDSNMISWEYPKSPHPVIQLQWKQVSSENEDKDRMFFSCKCVAAEKIVIQKPL